MRKKDSRDLNRREFMERSAKTIPVVIVPRLKLQSSPTNLRS